MSTWIQVYKMPTLASQKHDTMSAASTTRPHTEQALLAQEAAVHSCTPLLQLLTVAGAQPHTATHPQPGGHLVCNICMDYLTGIRSDKRSSLVSEIEVWGQRP